jgi:hypothetical protein
MTRRVIAGVFLGVVMTLSLAGIASAQGSGSGSGATTTTAAGGTTTTVAASTTLRSTAGSLTTARTGLNTGFLLLVGGGLTVIVLGARRLARTSAIS